MEHLEYIRQLPSTTLMTLANQAIREMDEFQLSLGFDDVAIRQKKNLCDSRLSVNVSSEVIRGVRRPVPLIASNMSTVTNADFCISLYRLGALGVMHRAAPEDVIISEISKIAKECEWVAGSIGIGKGQIELAQKMMKYGCNIIFVDIAHGYSQAVIEMGRNLKKIDSSVKIVLGNTTNVDMLYEVHEFVDGLKVGIAQGASCETKNTAGCTEKQFSAVYKFKHISRHTGLPIISDGGVREPADFTKAMGAGASAVMAGKIFAACPESAAETIPVGGKLQKVFSGMASRYTQSRWRGGLKDGTCPEGGVRYLDVGESAEKLLERYSGALRSGITYGGGKDIKSFQDNVEFIRIK